MSARLGRLLLATPLVLLPACPFRKDKGPETTKTIVPPAPTESTGIDPQSGKPLPGPPVTISTNHPRLLVRDTDLPRLRGWATDDNPIWANGFKPMIDTMKQTMDSGAVFKDDPASPGGYTATPPEAYAMAFAFYSLVAHSQAERDNATKRAHKLLMYVIEKAAKGAKDNEPFRDARFSIGDRSRWFGMSFPLTVDWIYGSLSKDDKKKIRTVFLRWAEEIQKAETTTYNHPEPAGVYNDPKLLADVKRVRWSGNNYYCAHARNLGMMAMSFDAADDPDEKLRNYLPIVTGSWLYVNDALMRSEARGGLAPEGFEYSPLSVGYIAQLLLALYTAGRSDTSIGGKQVTFAHNNFWDDTIPGFLHSLSPVAKVPHDQDIAYLGALHSVAWYGDGEKFWAPDFMGVFGPVGVWDYLTKNDKRLAQLRWIETHYAPGGQEKLHNRAGDNNDLLASIFYFMLFDPKAAAPAPDPRPQYPLHHFAEGIGRFLQRTSWKEDATWFTYKMGWITLDHQSADANMFELWRKGEWLTKERTGYGDDLACTDYKNSIAIQNDKPFHNEGYRGAEYKRGSQWTYVMDGDPKLLASRWGPDFSYFVGDATNLHNSKDENAQDVAHASRSIVWIVPDRIITYDRAESKKEKRFKRFWMQLPAQGHVAKDLMTMKSAGGQHLYVRTLLPNPASISVEPAEKLDDENGKQPAVLDPIKFRLRVEDPKTPKSVRWLHVIQGADGKDKADEATLVSSTSGTQMQGAFFHDTVVMFPVNIEKVTSVTYTAPIAKAHLITGLEPNASYKVVQKGGEVTVTPRSGPPDNDQKADRGGVLVIGKLP